MKLKAGDRLKLRHVRALADAIVANRPTGGDGIMVRAGDGGAAISLLGAGQRKPLVPFRLISLVQDDKQWKARFMPGRVGWDVKKYGEAGFGLFKMATIKEVDMDDKTKPELDVEAKGGELWLCVTVDKMEIDKAELTMKKEEAEKSDYCVQLGKFEVEGKKMVWVEEIVGDVFLPVGELMCPFYVVWEAPEAAAGGGGDAGSAGGGGSTPPAGGGGAEGDGGAPPKFKIKLNDGMVAALGDGFTSPFEGSIATLPTGMYGTREIKVDEAGYTGRYAVLKADIAYDGKIKLSFEGSEEDVKIAECDASGKPTCSRVVLSVYEEGQRVRSNLFLSPLYIGGGLHYFFTPFV